ncbi:short chain dehydrogenase [Xylariaceae sp. FL0255]|nr:short chain dehydrogenase [Xylariaceae sp. FL0255]
MSLSLPINDFGRVAGTATALAAALFALHRLLGTKKSNRPKVIPHSQERVLILGASSGLGRTLTKQYAARGARVCAVARRKTQLEQLASECGDNHCLYVPADFTVAADMLRLRDTLLLEWGGLDTIHICAGVSAVRTVMGLTGVDEAQTSQDDVDKAAIERAAEIAARAIQGNFFGPLNAATTFVPMLKRTSASPAILLVSSVAAAVPAPTRALYAATKAASLLLFQSLAIEQPSIAFTCILPATIEGNFRASAVDADPNKEPPETNKKGLKLGNVTSKCIEALDQGKRGNLFIPWFPYAIAHYLYYLWPSIIEQQARKKYDFMA